MARRLLAILCFVFVFLVFPSASFADDTQEEPQEEICQQWGINFWGLSYHVRRDVKYNETNWGLGVRCYERPKWRWLGTSKDNRVFLQVDAMLNSYSGPLFPVSAGVEYKLKTIHGSCNLSGIIALTIAYYQNPEDDVSEIRGGPVPGLAIGCGHFKTNVIFVPSPSKNPLAAIVASMTVLF